MTLTSDLVALCARPAVDLGPDLKYEYFDDDDYRAAAASLLGRRPDSEGEGAVWLFAYGSLIWKPEAQYAEQRRAVIHGWHRSFCMSLTRWRGTPEQPGLMMCLERGGSCEGVVYRLAPSNEVHDLDLLLQRELGSHEALDSVRWVSARTAQGPVPALAFYAHPSRLDTYVGKWPLSKVAHNLARACGHLGSAAEYLQQTVAKLEELGIRDRNLWALQHLVAEEIVRMREGGMMQESCAVGGG
ncbi:gamma-glutamylcyclotransferase [Nordella sp. HKS 07]|nr:gamma-glutamylcyclotransferase [Nordella sp. HKS 07]